MVRLISCFVVFAAVSAARLGQACDLCGCYTPQLDATAPQNKFGIYAGVAEQFTHFGTDRYDGHEVDNPTGEYLNSSITQLVIGTSLPIWQNRIGIQVNIPLVNRDFQRPNGFRVDRGDVFGIGDTSLVLNAIVFEKTSKPGDRPMNGMGKDEKQPVAALPTWPDYAVILNLTSGVKFPTGDTSRLKENFHEVDIPGAPESGIGGHDLTLGTGSYDALFGAQGLARVRSFFVQADAQFTLRTEGDYQYRFANDLSWSGGPGYYLWRRGDDKAIGCQCVLSGETKGYDRFQGAPDTDTGVTALYVGPRLLATWNRFAGEMSVDLPVIMNTTQFQSAPSWRVRAGFSWRF